MRSLLISSLLVTALAGVSTGESSHSKAGTSGGQALDVQSGVRPSALAGAYAAVAEDWNVLFNNPAGLAGIRKLELGGAFRVGIADVEYQNLTVIFPFKNVTASNLSRFGTLGVALETRSVDGIEGRDASGNRIGDTSADDKIFSIGYGRELSSTLLFGVRGRIFQFDLADESAEGIVGAAGVMYAPARSPFTAGAYLANVGTDIKFEQSGDPPPTFVKAGVAYRPYGDQLLLTLDTKFPRDNNASLQSGVEWWPNGVIALRAGYDTADDTGLGLTTGIGIALLDLEVRFFPIDRFMLDYTFVPQDDLDSVHQLALSARIDIL